MQLYQRSISSCAVQAGVFILSLGVAGIASAEGGFQLNCAESSIVNDTYLTSICQTLEGKSLHSTIDLNNYIAVEDGRLEWRRYGNYKPLTRFCHLHHEPYGFDHSVMVCSAKNNQGFWVQTSIDLSQHIGNEDGNLVFQGP